MRTEVAGFWTDDEYDRDQASDGISRYGGYVRKSQAVRRCWDGTWMDPQIRRARFAEAAWATATDGATSPGYVRHHPLIMSGRVDFNSWDATLTGAVRVIMPWPELLSRSRSWQRGGTWMDSQAHPEADGIHFREPNEDEMTRHRYVLAAAKIVFPLAPAWLPAAPSGESDNLTYTAQQAVRVTVAAMNNVITPLIEALERS